VDVADIHDVFTDTALSVNEYGVPADKSVMVIGLAIPLASANELPPFNEYWYFCKFGTPPVDAAKYTFNVVSDPETAVTE